MTKTANGAVRASINIILIYSPTSYRGSPGSNPGQTTWDSWSTGFHPLLAPRPPPLHFQPH
jgi:hypothetical protein